MTTTTTTMMMMMTTMMIMKKKTKKKEKKQKKRKKKKKFLDRLPFKNSKALYNEHCNRKKEERKQHKQIIATEQETETAATGIIMERGVRCT